MGDWRDLVALTQTSTACPAQWDGLTRDGRRVEVHYRSGWLDVWVGPAEGWTRYGWGTLVLERRFGGEWDGYMDPDTMLWLTGISLAPGHPIGFAARFHSMWLDELERRGTLELVVGHGA